MNAEELALQAMTTVSGRGKAEYFYATTRSVKGVMKAAAEMILAGERPDGAEELHTAALARAGISAKQYAAVSAMKRKIVADALAHLAGMAGDTKPATAPKRKGRPPRNGAAMSNRERQAAYQMRVRRAPDAIRRIKEIIDLPEEEMISFRKTQAIRDLISEYESGDQG